MVTDIKIDGNDVRKARGAYFTPEKVTDFITDWAIRAPEDRVLEPSAGEAEFLVSAVRRIRDLGDSNSRQPMWGFEIHEESAECGRRRIRLAGGEAAIACADFFSVSPEAVYDAVIGNPPYIRFQAFAGEARNRARSAAKRAGVELSGLASSWAAFVLHSALFLKEGGRLGMVLPAELLSVNYAAPVREYLLENFVSIQVVTFERQIFESAEADVVLLLADGFGSEGTDGIHIREAFAAESLVDLGPGRFWSPRHASDKWTGGLIAPTAAEPLRGLVERFHFSKLSTWGRISLGIVTGNNSYFTLSPSEVSRLQLSPDDLLKLSPPGSSHLRELELSDEMLEGLGGLGKRTFLFYPRDNWAEDASVREYIEYGAAAGFDRTYKTRTRKTWYKVPLVKTADLFLTCMNADTPRITTNQADAYHLNSVHGIYLSESLRDEGRELLPLASLNSVTMLNAESVGRAYGGGVLKLEPREASNWMLPSPSLVSASREELLEIKSRVATSLRSGRLMEAVAVVDEALLVGSAGLSRSDVQGVRAEYIEVSRRRQSKKKP